MDHAPADMDGYHFTNLVETNTELRRERAAFRTAETGPLSADRCHTKRQPTRNVNRGAVQGDAPLWLYLCLRFGATPQKAAA